MSHWYLIHDTAPLPAARNMAVDEHLFNLCQKKKQGFFRLYSWDKPSFSFGASQKISKAVNADYIEQHGYAYVRRITGGKTVMHHNEITYAVVSSEDIFYKDHDLYKSYMLISRVLVQAFQSLGIEAYLSAGSPSSLSKTDNPCFSFPTPNELEVGGKKIAGSAQKRNNRALLQHGSIPLEMDYQLYAGGANSRPAIIQRSMTTLSEVSAKTGGDLARALIQCFQAFTGEPFKEFTFETEDLETLQQLEKKYCSQDWNFSL